MAVDVAVKPNLGGTVPRSIPMEAAVERAVTFTDGPGFRIEILDDTHAMVEFEPRGKMEWHRLEIRPVRLYGDFEVLKRKLWMIALTRRDWLSRGDSAAAWYRMAVETGLLLPQPMWLRKPLNA